MQSIMMSLTISIAFRTRDMSIIPFTQNMNACPSESLISSNLPFTPPGIAAPKVDSNSDSVQTFHEYKL